MKTQKGHTDKNVAAWAKALTNDITKTVAKMPRANQELFKAFVGQSTGDGYVMIATDGCRALVKRGDGPVSEKLAVLRQRSPIALVPVWSDHLIGALGRMMAANSAKTPYVDLMGSGQSITVSTVDPTDHTEASEWFPSDAMFQRQTVNLKWLHDAAYLAGSTVRITDGPMVIEPLDGSYRYVVMPMTRETAQKAA